jgi:hypothetical protein
MIKSGKMLSILVQSDINIYIIWRGILHSDPSLAQILSSLPKGRGVPSSFETTGLQSYPWKIKLVMKNAFTAKIFSKH